MLSLLLALVFACILVSASERLLKPRPISITSMGYSARGLPAVVVHFAIIILHYMFWFFLVQRPWFALIIVLSLHLVVVQVNNTKSTSLHEPFLVQDFEYFLDAIKHPRLYIPFFGITLTIAALTAGAIAIALCLYLEPSIFTGKLAPWNVFLSLIVITASFCAIGFSQKKLPDCTLDPILDMQKMGLLPYLLAYAKMIRNPIDLSNNKTQFTTVTKTEKLPFITLIQGEAFFDPRKAFTNIKPSILCAFDQLSEEALAHGELEVPAWGANTVRTEAAVLTGLTEDELGVHRFNPYHQLSKLQVNNLAAGLKALGYRTICIHPYPKQFYFRDKVFPLQGIDEFIDIQDFDTAKRDGQYIADIAVAEKVIELQKQNDDQPLFIFVITMESHGPLHLEKISPHQLNDWAPVDQDKALFELGIYLRHLKNCDDFLARLKSHMIESKQAGILAFYGDHVPIMPAVYRKLGEPTGLTDYFIWQTPCTDYKIKTDKQTISADSLGRIIYNIVTG